MEKAARVCGAGKRGTLKPIGLEAATSDGNKARRILSAPCGVQIPAASTMPANIRGGYSLNRSWNETSASGSGVIGLI